MRWFVWVSALFLLCAVQARAEAPLCEDLEACERACDSGDARSCLAYAEALKEDEHGLGARVERWMAPSCARGDVDACYYVAQARQGREGFQRDFAGVDTLTPLCRAGDLDACDGVLTMTLGSSLPRSEEAFELALQVVGDRCEADAEPASCAALAILHATRHDGASRDAALQEMGGLCEQDLDRCELIAAALAQERLGLRPGDWRRAGLPRLGASLDRSYRRTVSLYGLERASAPRVRAYEADAARQCGQGSSEHCRRLVVQGIARQRQCWEERRSDTCPSRDLWAKACVGGFELACGLYDAVHTVSPDCEGCLRAAQHALPRGNAHPELEALCEKGQKEACSFAEALRPLPTDGPDKPELMDALAACEAGKDARCRPLAAYIAHVGFDDDGLADDLNLATACAGGHEPACAQLAKDYIRALRHPSLREPGVAMWEKRCKAGDLSLCVGLTDLDPERADDRRDAVLRVAARRCGVDEPAACGLYIEFHGSNRDAPEIQDLISRLWRDIDRDCTRGSPTACQTGAQLARDGSIDITPLLHHSRAYRTDQFSYAMPIPHIRGTADTWMERVGGAHQIACKRGERCDEALRWLLRRRARCGEDEACQRSTRTARKALCKAGAAQACALNKPAPACAPDDPESCWRSGIAKIWAGSPGASDALHLACTGRHPDACSLLPRREIDTPPPDPCPAGACVAACDAGDAAACHALSRTRLPSDRGTLRARAFASRRCEAGMLEACAWMAESLSRLDDASALTYARKACDGGQPHGCLLASKIAPEDKTTYLRSFATLIEARCPKDRSACTEAAAVYRDIDDEAGAARTLSALIQLQRAACEGGDFDACWALTWASEDGELRSSGWVEGDLPGLNIPRASAFNARIPLPRDLAVSPDLGLELSASAADACKAGDLDACRHWVQGVAIAAKLCGAGSPCRRPLNAAAEGLCTDGARFACRHRNSPGSQAWSLAMYGLIDRSWSEYGSSCVEAPTADLCTLTYLLQIWDWEAHPHEREARIVEQGRLACEAGSELACATLKAATE